LQNYTVFAELVQRCTNGKKVCHTDDRLDPNKREKEGAVMTLRTTSSIVAIVESWRQHGQSEHLGAATVDPFLFECARDVFFVRALTYTERYRLCRVYPSLELDEDLVWFGAIASDNYTIQAVSDSLETLLEELENIGYDIHEPS
jgi:hypothetical protein